MCPQKGTFNKLEVPILFNNDENKTFWRENNLPK